MQLPISGTNLLFGGLNLSPLISLNGNFLPHSSLQSTNNAIVATIDPSLLDPAINLVGISDPLGLLSPVRSLPLSLVGLNCLSTGAPSISAVIPNQGTTTGGTDVLISGANFPSDVTVSFDGVVATAVTVQSPSAIVAVTPPHAAGPVDVTVTEVGNPFTTATLANGFTYITPTTIGNVSACISNGASTLTVTGQVPPTTNGRVTFLATIQDNAALGGVEASMSPTGPWQHVVVITSIGNNGNPYRIAGGFDTTNPAFGGSATAGNKLVCIGAIHAQSNVSAAQP